MASNLKTRRGASQSRRRLILDDDGDLVYDRQSQQGPEAFCGLRLGEILDKPVDSINWCMMWGIATKGDNPVRYWQTQKLGTAFQENMPDPTDAVVQFCQQHGKEVFGSIRMNDGHDAFGMPFDRLVYPLKVEHPEYLLGQESQKGNAHSGLEAAMWSGLDYKHEQVREDRLWWIKHTASSYDLEGVDLNFFRMPWYFKLGEESRNIPLMTDLIRRARQGLDQIGQRRGRPVLLSVRVPGTVQTCLRIGLDIETWLKEGLIDRLLTGGGYVSFSTPAEELIELGHKYGVPVYPCINCPPTYGSCDGKGFEALRGAASNMWWAGADGLYLWNFHYIPTEHPYGQPTREDYQLLQEISDPTKLGRLNKTFLVDTSKGLWEQYARASAPCPLPLDLGRSKGGSQHRIPIRIGDDLPLAARDKAIEEVELGLQIKGLVNGHTINFNLNGVTLDPIKFPAKDPLTLAIDPSVMKRGINYLDILVAGPGQVAQGNLILERVWVSVRYKN